MSSSGGLFALRKKEKILSQSSMGITLNCLPQLAILATSNQFMKARTISIAVHVSPFPVSIEDTKCTGNRKRHGWAAARLHWNENFGQSTHTRVFHWNYPRLPSQVAALATLNQFKGAKINLKFRKCQVRNSRQLAAISHKTTGARMSKLVLTHTVPISHTNC